MVPKQLSEVVSYLQEIIGHRLEHDMWLNVTGNKKEKQPVKRYPDNKIFQAKNLWDRFAKVLISFESRGIIAVILFPLESY